MPKNPLIIGRVEGVLSDSDIQGLSEHLISKFGRNSFHDHLPPATRLEHEDYEYYFPSKAGEGFEVYATTPYYGPEYKRGDWEKIKSIFRFLNQVLPNAQLFYGNDSEDKLFEFTDAYISELDHLV